jgi:hypothetical protein
LTKNDRDYLGLKVAEKTAFLLETTQENRIILYKALKKFYRLRSELIHSGSRKIQESEFIQLKNLVYRTLLKMLDLSIYYTQMEEQSEESKEIKIDGIEDILLKLKFDGPKT